MTPSAVGVTHYAPLGAAGIMAPMGPFCKPHVQRGVLIQKDSFNAVLYKEVIRKKKEITYQRKKYRLLYNPILNYISEDNRQYGSFYYTGGSKSLYWYCYDQVLMTRELMDDFKEMEYCQSIGGKLITLSTCEYSRTNGRMVIVAKLVVPSAEEVDADARH